MKIPKRNIRIKFDESELNSKIQELEENGFEEYLQTFERWTVYDEENMYHTIMIGKNGEFEQWQCDIYWNEETHKAWMIFVKPCCECDGSGWFSVNLDGSGDVEVDTTEHFPCPNCNKDESVSLYYRTYFFKNGELTDFFYHKQNGLQTEITAKEYYNNFI